MTQLDVLVKNLTDNLEMLKHHLADFSDTDMMVRPVPAANHAAWQLGHLVFFEVMVCGMYELKGAPKLADDAKTLYGKDGASIDDPERFYKKEEGLNLLSQAHGVIVEWVKTLSEADLARPGPPPFKGWVDTIGDLLVAIPGHAMMHIGQFQVIRRKLGKKILF